MKTYSIESETESCHVAALSAWEALGKSGLKFNGMRRTVAPRGCLLLVARNKSIWVRPVEGKQGENAMKTATKTAATKAIPASKRTAKAKIAKAKIAKRAAKAKVKTAKPKSVKAADASKDHSAAISKSWQDKDIAAARSERTAVVVEGHGEFRSVAKAFEALGVPMKFMGKFRIGLKAEGKKTLSHDGKDYKFAVAKS